jgi:hypothetical protein
MTRAGIAGHRVRPQRGSRGGSAATLTSTSFSLTVGTNTLLISTPVTPGTLRVPIIYPCWSDDMPILVEDAVEPVPSVDIQLRDPLRSGLDIATWVFTRALLSVLSAANA